MHKVANIVAESVSIPLIHIADATGEKLVQDKITKVGLLGTKFTMEQDFYKGRLTKKFDIEVLTPESEEQAMIHEVIYQELCLGEIKSASREQYLAVIDKLAKRGAQAVILGCTEIAMLVEQPHTSMPLYDTTAIHAQKAVQLALS